MLMDIVLTHLSLPHVLEVEAFVHLRLELRLEGTFHSTPRLTYLALDQRIGLLPCNAHPNPPGIASKNM